MATILVVSLLITFALFTELVEPSQDYPSCPVAEPPIDLGTGVLDQLIDVMLNRLITGESSIIIDKRIKLTTGLYATRIRMYRLDSIRRKCTIQLSSKDRAGCHQRGFLVNACFGFSPLNMDITMESRLPGLPHGEFKLEIPRISMDALIEVFSSGSSTPLNQPPSRETANGETDYPFARIIRLDFTEFDPIDISTIGGGLFGHVKGWLAETYFNSFIGKDVAGKMTDALNKQLRELSLQALFTNTTRNIIEKTSSRPKPKPKQKRPSVTRMASGKVSVVPSRIVAIPIFLTIMNIIVS